MSEKKEEAPAAAETEGEGDAPKKGKKKLIIIIAAVVVLAVVGVLASGVLGGGKEKKDTETEATDEHHEPEESGHGEEKDAHGDDHGKEDGGHEDAEEESGHGGGHGKDGDKGHATLPGQPIYYELPQFLVNLNTTNGRVSFIKMSVTLELKDKKSLAVVEANKPRIVDTFTTYLRELRASDVQGSAGIFRLRDELLARMNATIAGEPVKDILFSEIIVQ